MTFQPRNVARALLVAAFSLLLAGRGHASLVIAGVSDGDLPGGQPRAIFLQTATPIADLSLWGVGVANNGGGTDGQEFTFPSISAAAGDVFVLAANANSQAFFQNNFSDPFIYFIDSDFVVSGDDAIEVFQGGGVFDVFGDPDIDGTGEDWEYKDGFALRLPNTNPSSQQGGFQASDYLIQNSGFDGLDEMGHVALFAEVAGFTPINPIPEPSAAILALLACTLLLRRRR
ncbi:MAG: hypothetical protein GY899_00680 [Verrucomicrobiaceae bacterium]|nr:hypothetical protein [Verrucomicrobiaceae bacterium]